MGKIMRKIVCKVIIIGCVIGGVFSHEINAIRALDSILKIHFIDVGSGSAVYIEFGEYNMLIDGGYLTQATREADLTLNTKIDEMMTSSPALLDETSDTFIDDMKAILSEHDNSDVTRYLDSLGVSHINYLVLTHPHFDHVGGMLQVINKYTYDTLYYNGKDYNTRYYRYFKLLAEENALVNENPLQVPQVHDILTFSVGQKKLSLEFISDTTYDFNEISGNGDVENNESIVVKVTYDTRTFLLTGDIQVAAQQFLIEQKNQYVKDIDVLLVPHHGHTNNDFGVSDKSGNYPFFVETNPAVSIVQNGIANASLAIPTRKVINDLSMSDMYTTKDLGSIVVECDGDRVIVKYGTETIYAISTGDTNSDGYITPADYVILRKHINGTSLLKGGALRSGDINGDGEITPADYVKLRKVLNGTDSL